MRSKTFGEPQPRCARVIDGEVCGPESPTQIADAFVAGCQRGRADVLLILDQFDRKYRCLDRERGLLQKVRDAITK